MNEKSYPIDSQINSKFHMLHNQGQNIMDNSEDLEIDDHDEHHNIANGDSSKEKMYSYVNRMFDSDPNP